jgi:hypothetical protein
MILIWLVKRSIILLCLTVFEENQRSAQEVQNAREVQNGDLRRQSLHPKCSRNGGENYSCVE